MSRVRVQQPDRWTCGQAVLAMITGDPMADVIAKVPGTYGTQGHQLRAYLLERGWTASIPQRWPFRPLVFRTDPLQLAILRLRWGEKAHRSHWTLYVGDGRVLDPAPSLDFITHADHYPLVGGRIMTYMVVYKST